MNASAPSEDQLLKKYLHGRVRQTQGVGRCKRVGLGGVQTGSGGEKGRRPSRLFVKFGV